MLELEKIRCFWLKDIKSPASPFIAAFSKKKDLLKIKENTYKELLLCIYFLYFFFAKKNG